MNQLKKKFNAVLLGSLLALSPMAAWADTYEVPVSLKQAGKPDVVSMSNAALKPTALADVKAGKTLYSLRFRPMQLMGMTGEITNLFLYEGAEKSEIATKPISDGEYNKEASFTRTASKEEAIKVAVWVDAMDQLQGGKPGAGEQDVLVSLDWSQAKLISESEKPKENKGLQPVGNDPIQVFVKGNKLQSDVAPQIEAGRALVPLRAIFEALGADVNWDEATRTVTAKKDGHQLSLGIDQVNATVDGQTKQLDVPAKIIDGRTFVPFRFVGEAFGNAVDYQKQGEIAVISIQ